MAKHWKERLDIEVHRDFMTGEQFPGGVLLEADADPLLERWVYFVRECGFTFQFPSVSAVRECLEYFSRKTRPSTRRTQECSLRSHRWFERLPAGLTKGQKRVRIATALERALVAFGDPDVNAG